MGDEYLVECIEYGYVVVYFVVDIGFVKCGVGE